MADQQPLKGRRIVSTRPETQAGEFVSLLREAGAVPIIFPTIQITPLSDTGRLDGALKTLSAYDWVIFTSVNGVTVTVDRMKAIKVPLGDLHARRIAVIGPATDSALRSYGIEASLRPAEYVAEAIVESLTAQETLRDKRFLLLRADIARPVLRELLVAQGALVDEIPVYQTRQGAPESQAYAELRAGVDVITFTSSSTVRYFFALLGAEARTIVDNALIACIGPITAQTARELGLRVDLVAEEYTARGLIAALAKHFAAER